MSEVSIGIIGGSGFHKLHGVSNVEFIDVETPYGQPSSSIAIGSFHGKKVAFLRRHGSGHRLSPSMVPYRANIFALKQIGARFIISVNACGSLIDEYAPGDIVIPDQILDATKSERGGRSFFQDGVVAHVDVAHPFCADLADIVFSSALRIVGNVHKGGNFVTIEGPRFSTKSESQMYRILGGNIIGMTASPEAFLAREAEISYASIAHVTDYDVWNQDVSPVTVEMVKEIFAKNIETVGKIVSEAISNIDTSTIFASHNSLSNALVTRLKKASPSAIDKLKIIIARYMDN